MPVLTKINTNVIADDAVTSAKIPADSIISDDLAPNIALTGGSVSIPTVTTANLPGAGGGTNASLTATDGMLVYNSTLGMLQQRASGIWSGITTAPVITSFTYSDGAAATAEKTVVGLVSVSCTTQTSTTVLVPGASLGIQVGMVVAGTGIPAGATVVSVIEDTSFVLSSAATASATVTLTFGGVVTITGTNFDSILGGSSANIAVTFDGTSATSISVNSLKTIITCTPPAHAAGTITLLVTNASGLTASTNFVYDVEPIFTTAAGSLGSFVDATYTANADAPRIQGTENSVALTTGFQRVTSATDDTVITSTIQGLTVLTSGYLTGTLSATEGTTYPFYATAMDNENQRTAPRLFNIISAFADPTGGTIIEPGAYTGDFRSHTFFVAGNGSGTNILVTYETLDIGYLIIGGGGSGGASANGDSGGGGGGGAGALITAASYSLAAGSYTIVVGAGGTGAAVGADETVQGVNTTFAVTSGSTIFTAGGGGGGGTYATTGSLSGAGANGTNGSSGGGGSGGSRAGGAGNGVGTAGGTSGNYGAGGGGGSGGAGTGGGTSNGTAGGIGSVNVYRDGSNVTYTSGGGGGAYGGTGGTASAGGGAAGGNGGVANDGADATANTGGGGGGGGGGLSSGTRGGGGNGGSGIVVIRYAA